MTADSFRARRDRQAPRDPWGRPAHGAVRGQPGQPGPPDLQAQLAPIHRYRDLREQQAPPAQPDRRGSRGHLDRLEQMALPERLARPDPQDPRALRE